MCVDDEILRLLTAETPRPVFHGGETALAILESELASVAAFDLDLAGPDRHERIAAAARECLRRGSRWDHRQPEPRQGQAAPPPTARPAPTPRKRARGSPPKTRTAEALARMNANLGLGLHRHRRCRPGAGSVRCRGWAIWLDDGVWMVGLCDGVVNQGGLLVEASVMAATATAAAGTGVGAGARQIARSIPVAAFIGLPVKEFEAVVRPMTRRGAGGEAVTERLTLAALRRLRETYRTQGSLGSLLARIEEVKARRAAARANERTRRTR